MTSKTDILSTIQNGVQAVNNLVKTVSDITLFSSNTLNADLDLHGHNLIDSTLNDPAGDKLTPRIRLFSATTIYVATTGNDSNPGTAASPFLTLQAAFDHIIFNYDLNANTVVLQVQDGTYTAGIFNKWSVVGDTNASTTVGLFGGLFIQGNASDATKVIISGIAGGPAFNIQGGITCAISGFTILNCNEGIVCLDTSHVYIGTVIFNGCPNHCISCSSLIFLDSNSVLTFKGSNGTGFFAETSRAHIDTNSPTFNFVGVPSFSGGFVYAFEAATIYINGTVTVTGTFTGTAVLAQSGFVIDTFGLGSLGTIATDAIGSYNHVAVSGIGYNTNLSDFGPTSAGAGGTVSQTTSKSSSVTLNTATGQITMNSSSLAANTTVSFTLNNTLLSTSGDVLILNHISGGTAGSYMLNAQTTSGSASINVRNVTSGALAEAIVIQYALVRGAIS